MRLLYPEVYPLAAGSFDGLAQAAVHTVETLLWRKALDALFHAAAEWLELPALTSLVREGRLHYPELAADSPALSFLQRVPA